jgi:FG-GAP repeat.
LHGNLNDVSNFDWSLPGDITDSTYYSGGILIWHIDENVIDANISSNTINNNLSHRGVCVMEAKGAQLIGVTVSTAFGLVTGEGTPYDYWYNGYHYVPSTVYKNEFTPSSMPNSLSYSLANNNIFITEFDSTKDVMNFHIRVGNQIKPIAGFPKYIGTPLEFNSAPIAFDLNRDGKDEIFANNGKDIYGFSADGQPLNGTDGILVHSCGSYPPSIAYIPPLNSVRLIGISNTASSSKVGYFGFNNAFQMIDSSYDYFASSISSYPLVMDSLNLILGFNSGNVMRKDLNALILYKMDSTSLPVNSLSKHPQNSFTFGSGDYYAVDGNIRDNDFNLKYSASEILYGGGKFADNYKFGKIDNRIILADVNKDNHQEVIFVADGKLFAVNSSGVMLDNFPLTVPAGIVSIPVAADINNDGVMDILVVNSLGDVYAYGTNGKIVEGFPFKTGAAVNSSPAFFNYHDTLAFAVYGKDGYLYAYKTLYQYTPQNILWKNINNDRYFSNNNFYGITSTPVVYSEKLPKDRAYNWPNPVYDSKTYIRYYINGSGSGTTVKIVDLAGNLITKLTGTSYSNTDNEVVWDVSSVQSGVYYGIIESTIDGSLEKRVIKIAVIK